jgi:hypothetical protein
VLRGEAIDDAFRRVRAMAGAPTVLPPASLSSTKSWALG